MKNYVLGFTYNPTKTRMLLIKNGEGVFDAIGGQMMEEEYAETAIHRVFQEKTDIDIPQDQWDMFFEFTNEDEDTPEEQWIKVVCYKAELTVLDENVNIENNKNNTLRTYYPAHMDLPIKDHLKYLIPLAMDDKFLFGNGSIK